MCVHTCMLQWNLSAVNASDFVVSSWYITGKGALEDMALVLASDPNVPAFKFLKKPLKLKVSVTWLAV